jgi:hypothetical protein
MKLLSKSVLAVALVLGSTCAVAPVATAAEPAAPAPAAALSVTAKLVEIPGKLPSDDLYDYAYVMRYQVVGGPLDGQSLLVAHYKPKQPRAKIKDKMKGVVSGKLRSFTVGDLHKLKLTSDIKKVWPGPLVDEFAATDRKTVRYFCLEADPA